MYQSTTGLLVSEVDLEEEQKSHRSDGNFGLNQSYVYDDETSEQNSENYHKNEVMYQKKLTFGAQESKFVHIQPDLRQVKTLNVSHLENEESNMVIDSDSSQENDENPYGNGQKDYKKEITGQLGSYFQSSMKSKGKN